MTKFIFVVGGVISGVGKGITTAALGKIFKEYGYTTTLIKIDPYINYDAGTLRPTEHGEVWVTDDGGEIDQDLGTYERFMDQDMPKMNNMTTGQIYKAVIDRERNGDFLGATVQFIPHIPDEIVRRINQASEGYEVAIVEIGGVVGDYENIPYLFAAKMLEQDIGTQHVAYVLVTYLPVPTHTKEMKTKPTQLAVKMLREEGIFADFIICRAQMAIDQVNKEKIQKLTHTPAGRVIAAPDLASVYEAPLALEEEQVGIKMLTRLGLEPKRKPNWKSWQQQVKHLIAPQRTVNVAIVGKYLMNGEFMSTDSYVSVAHALQHAGAQLGVGVEIAWLDSCSFEHNPEKINELAQYAGIIVPGGFGATGVEGKIKAIEYARINKIPYLGLCYGMQLAVVEFARHVADLANANTTEVDAQTPYPVIDILPLQKEIMQQGRYGGTMRLGAQPAVVNKGSVVLNLYEECGRLAEDRKKFLALSSEQKEGMPSDQAIVIERHRHRFEVNPAYVTVLEQKGLVFSGYCIRADGTKLMEFIELPGHPFFVGTQAHPEFKSRLCNPSPLFYGFVASCLTNAAE